MFGTKKIALMMAILMMAMFAFSVFGTINADAVVWDPDYLDVDSDGVVNSSATNTTDTFDHIMTEYKGIITFVGGIATVTMVAIFVLNFMKLGSVSTNPTERSKVLTGLLWSGIAAALLGSVTLIVGVFYGMLR